MKFDLENLNPGTFFPFPEEDGEGGVTIRLASGDELSRIEKACVKKKYEYKKNQRFEVIDEDEIKRSRMLWDYVIVSWEGLTDTEGKPIPCIMENKVKLMQNSTKFSTFVSECISVLTDQMDTYRDSLEKNFSR